jgi:hypothetical protein
MKSLTTPTSKNVLVKEAALSNQKKKNKTHAHSSIT